MAPAGPRRRSAGGAQRPRCAGGGARRAIPREGPSLD
eukprot:CAMPEP_0176228174 /NCGR_PEP_ID=MMETSP0121_2-20121125/23140_1 /TAXON_ID=160619 /ORGANISM="Kryptoperidinium foliaceum, Strain CCMP 1326" /LENGTH=36 /DNA_ID= /DNA_START= /DNA_END= /DNA_ORIENTATION=